MGEIVRLVQHAVSDETVAALSYLLQEARAGHVVGLAYIALHNSSSDYSADATGAARISRTFTMGALLRLNDYIGNIPPAKG